MPTEMESTTTWEKIKEIIEKKLDELTKRYFNKDIIEFSPPSPLTLRTYELIRPWLIQETKYENYIKPEEGEWTPQNLTKEVIEQLILEAQKAKPHSFSCYEFKDETGGAAILTKDGQIFHGSHIDMGVNGNSHAAEIALSNGLTKINNYKSVKKQKEFVAIAIIPTNEKFSRVLHTSTIDFLHIFNPDMKVFLATINGSYKEIILRDYHGRINAYWW